MKLRLLNYTCLRVMHRDIDRLLSRYIVNELHDPLWGDGYSRPTMFETWALPLFSINSSLYTPVSETLHEARSRRD